jgi:hypothetical protein
MGIVLLFSRTFNHYSHCIIALDPRFKLNAYRNDNRFSEQFEAARKLLMKAV